MKELMIEVPEWFEKKFADEAKAMKTTANKLSAFFLRKEVVHTPEPKRLSIERKVVHTQEQPA